MSREEQLSLRDVTNAGIAVSDRITRDVSSYVDLEESLEASRYASHPYSTHPKEVLPPPFSISNRYPTVALAVPALCVCINQLLCAGSVLAVRDLVFWYGFAFEVFALHKAYL